jgi:hypothetical protein
MKIQLTVIKKDGKTVSPGVVYAFESSALNNIVSSGSGIAFEVLGDVQGGREVSKYEASESFSSVMATLGSTDTNIKKSVVLVFDATGGKAVGSYDLKDINGNPFYLPQYSTVVRAEYKVKTTFASAGADAGTIALGIPTDDVAGIKAAIAISNGANPYDAAGFVATIQDGAVSNYSEETTDERAIQATVAVQNLTAGKLYLVVDYVIIGA